MTQTNTEYIRSEIVKDVPIALQHQIQQIIESNRNKAGAIIQVLQQVQGITGYLPSPVLHIISGYTRIPLSEIYGIVSFYHFFSLVPKGKHVIQVCLGTSCYVKGGQKILGTLKNDLAIVPGGITEDGIFSLEVVRCLGCCGLSPVMAIGEDIHRKMKPSKLKDILTLYT